MLASEDVLSGLDDFLTRRLGTFVLAGKTKPLVIHELMCRRAEASHYQCSMVALFAEGVAAFERRSWIEASAAFDACIREGGNDAAARFYLAACSEYRTRDPREPWEPLFRLESK